MSNPEHPRITEVGRLLAEIDRLRDMATVKASLRWRDERDRLREALEKIVAIKFYSSSEAEAWTIARAALAKEAGQQKEEP